MAEEIEEQFQTHVNTWDGRGLLNLLNLLFKNSLTNESPRSEKPTSIKIQPRPHQLAVLSAMEKMEQEEIKSIVKKYKEKLKKFRNCGLEKDGEMSLENLVFKLLRRNGYIAKIMVLKRELYDKQFK